MSLQSSEAELPILLLEVGMLYWHRRSEWQLEAPAKLYVPVEQLKQLPSLVCPILAWYFPREQLVQSMLSSPLENFPVGQTRQFALPVAPLYLPARHEVHAEAVVAPSDP